MTPKVRLWNKEYKQMAYGSMSDYVSFGDYMDAEKKHYSCTPSMQMAEYFGMSGIIVMLSTGLVDRNGREIYQKDCIKNESGRVSELVWKENLAAFDTVPLNSVGTPKGMRPYEWKKRVEVVGNRIEGWR